MSTEIDHIIDLAEAVERLAAVTSTLVSHTKRLEYRVAFLEEMLLGSR